jgi:hypothetical protein
MYCVTSPGAIDQSGEELPMSRVRTSQPVAMPGSERIPMGTLAHLRCRHELSVLTPEQMRDVGLDAEAVRRESHKPFWIA